VLVINTTEARKGVIADSRLIRISALQARVPYYTHHGGRAGSVPGHEAVRATLTALRPEKPARRNRADIKAGCKKKTAPTAPFFYAPGNYLKVCSI